MNFSVVFWGKTNQSLYNLKLLKVRPETAIFQHPTQPSTQKYTTALSPTPVQAYSCNTFSKYNEYKKIKNMNWTNP